MKDYDDYDFSSLSDIKSDLLSTEEGREAWDDLQARKALVMQLKLARKAKKMTQEEVAARMGTKKQNISRLERGTTEPLLGTLNRYAAVLGGRLVFQMESAT
ncbi:helix-turn-helix transcriptional regulator [Salmonella enterica subsp. enterica serovar Legon]|nr:XRE family transcriptional regulator [Salmonella enterica subsp. enterica serovar Weybridge]EDS6807482.1 helix-turn-helix transcriptional regulator [Salmonella enterica subsp. enterica serovar Legon]EDW9825345.1 helix-turn-helix transcriptional regulator [Salmonella enterica]EDZ3590761.1 helix-turn-helix domain-containing protein [Salmonella enterica subsp. enterica serovar Wagenia]EHL5833688.1 helix-turn-helix transcriptional regulator [Salmonella enterica]